MREKKNPNSAERLYKFFIYLVLIMLAVSIIIPVAWVFMASIKQNKEFYGLCRRVFIFRTLLMPGIQQKWEITC